MTGTHQSGGYVAIMKTRIITWMYPSTLIVAVSVAVFAWAQDSPSTKPKVADEDSISVESFNQKKVIGYLGQPLGTVVRVTGVSVDGATLRTKGADGKTFLRIETVNGKKLKSPVDFQVPHYEKDVQKPKPEERFDYYVHEQGEFEGVVHPPAELGLAKNGNVIGLAGPVFHYQRAVVIYKSFPVKK
jgi:hypothetical protein